VSSSAFYYSEIRDGDEGYNDGKSGGYEREYTGLKERPGKVVAEEIVDLICQGGVFPENEVVDLCYVCVVHEELAEHAEQEKRYQCEADEKDAPCGKKGVDSSLGDCAGIVSGSPNTAACG
jgi:hypothetical protein